MRMPTTAARLPTKVPGGWGSGTALPLIVALGVVGRYADGHQREKEPLR